MATYITSDIHGECDLFLRLLSEINFKADDDMIIAGDLLEKGCQSIKLVDFLLDKKNIRVIKGNHEHAFLRKYEAEMRRLEDGDDVDGVLEKLQAFFPSDAEKMSWEFVDYIDGLPLYIEENDFICVHAGVELDDKKRIIPLKRQYYGYLLFDRNFQNESIVPQSSKTVFFGHTPCSFDNQTGDFIKTLKTGATANGDFRNYAKIRLDCGVYLTGRLGALRLDDMKEFYVQKN